MSDIAPEIHVDHIANEDFAQRHIRSFVMRRGHITAAQIEAHARLMPQWGIPWSDKTPNWEAIFGRKAPLVLEIGFGMGETTARIASAHPDTNFLGAEVYGAGVGALLKRIDEQQIPNIRIIQHDVVEVLRTMIPLNFLSGVHLFFPDPWPKARHHKRRLVQPAFIQQLAKHLAPSGYIHMATDWENYAEQMLEVLAREPLLRNRYDGFAPRPDYRPLTKFEQRGLRLGHGVWDLIFEKAA